MRPNARTCKHARTPPNITTATVPSARAHTLSERRERTRPCPTTHDTHVQPHPPLGARGRTPRHPRTGGPHARTRAEGTDAPCGSTGRGPPPFARCPLDSPPADRAPPHRRTLPGGRGRRGRTRPPVRSHSSNDRWLTSLTLPAGSVWPKPAERERIQSRDCCLACACAGGGPHTARRSERCMHHRSRT